MFHPRSRWNRFVPATWSLLLVLLWIGGAAPSSAIPFTIKITADNNYAVYTGTVNAVTALHLAGSWSTVKSQAITPVATNNVLYVVAWDDGQVYQGLLATVSAGTGTVNTGSSLWTVCAANTPVSVAPTPANLTVKIAACNKTGGWRPTSRGPNDGSASSLWGNLPTMDDTADWIWHNNPSAPCPGSGNYPFLQGACNPGEYLIFRISLEEVVRCPPPVPSFTMNWTAGYGMLVADGTNSQNEQNYFWSIQESDQSWNLKGPEIMQWFPGQAGAFDLKAFFEGKGQRLKCDTYYRVKLAVANQCVSWRDTIRLVKLNCCPGEVIAPPPARGSIAPRRLPR